MKSEILFKKLNLVTWKKWGSDKMSEWERDKKVCVAHIKNLYHPHHWKEKKNEISDNLYLSREAFFLCFFSSSIYSGHWHYNVV